MRLLALTLVLAAGALLGTPNSARCAWCPTYKCYGANSCGMNCQCLSTDYSGGKCVSLQHAPRP